MNKRLWLLASIAGLVFSLTAGAFSVAPSPASDVPSPLISAEPLGSASYDTLVASLQDKIDRSNAFDQGWLQKLWTWVCYVLHDVLHDPRLVLYVKINYMTTTAAGDRIPVTGLAILPQPYPLHRTVPMISFQHPTEVERRFSPSMFNMTNMWDDATFDVPFATLYAQSGFAVVLADYPGMGVNTNVHPYCTESLANSVVDMVRAVRDYMRTNTATYAAWDGRLYLTGYSEGGYATVMAARDLQTRYASEFTNVVGVAGLDGPYSLSDTMRNVMLTAGATFPSPYFMPYTINGYDSVYADWDSMFNFTNAVKVSVPNEPEFAAKLRHMCTAGTNTSDEIDALITNATPYVGPRSILTDTYIAALSNSDSSVCRVLASNDAYFAWTPQMKMRLFHYPNDDLVPYGNTTNAYHVFNQRHAPHTDVDTYGAHWPLNELIEWLKGKVGTYHVAAAPVAYVKGILWLHSLAYGWDLVPQYSPNDVDGDNLSDLVLYDENTGTWRMLLSNRVRSWRKPNPDPALPKSVQVTTLNGPGYTPILKDFDGDGKADPGVYQTATGAWTVWLSLFDYASIAFTLGDADSVPVPQDYDGDRLADPAVYKSATGLWTVYLAPSNQVMTAQFGAPGYVPVNGDYDGDGKADLVVYQETSGLWVAALSGNNYAIATALCGGPGYTPVPGDFDGDGKTDLAGYQESTGNWRLLLSANGYTQDDFNFGGPGYLPVVGDYDADGKADFMVYQASSGLWGSKLSTDGYEIVLGYFSGAGYIPVQ